MPNWCEQELIITGNYEVLEDFIKHAKTERKCLDEEKFIPMPSSLREVQSGSEDILYDIWYGDISYVKDYEWIPSEIRNDREKLKEFFRKRHENADEKAAKYKYNVDNFGCKTWYEWAYQNWGSKWGISEPFFESRPRSIAYIFASAWSPVTPVILRMSSMFPALKFRLKYYEGGVGFQGEFVCENGAILKDETKEYHGHRGG